MAMKKSHFGDLFLALNIILVEGHLASFPERDNGFYRQAFPRTHPLMPFYEAWRLYCELIRRGVGSLEMSDRPSVYFQLYDRSRTAELSNEVWEEWVEWEEEWAVIGKF